MTQPSLMDLGIIGGGQLAAMMAERAAKLGLTTVVLDPSEDCAAGKIANLSVQSAFDDPIGLRSVVELSRVSTLDIEAPDAKILTQLEAEGHTIFPQPRVLAIIQDKLVQRQFLAEHGLPVPRFMDLPDPTPESMAEFGFPLVQKARRGGYDGRGVAVLRNVAEFERYLKAPSMIEDKIDIAHELAVLVARRPTGQVVCYDVAELFPDAETHVLEALVYPAQLDEQLQRDAKDLGISAIEALDGVGIFAIELFVDTGGKLWINEISPRPHNAGHVTLEASVTCQFEQHMRAVLDLPFGDARTLSPAAMVNILGPSRIKGEIRGANLQEPFADPGARIHFYGKKQTWPGRKLGHLTVLDEDPERALRRARQARDRLLLCADEAVA